MRFFIRVLPTGKILLKDLETQGSIIVNNTVEACKKIQERIDEQEEEITGDNDGDSGSVPTSEQIDGE